MANLLDIVNKAGIVGTDSTTLAANVVDKFTKMSTKFGNVAAVAPDKGPPPRDTGILPINSFISMIKDEGLAKHNHYAFTFIPPGQIDGFFDETGNKVGGVGPRKLQLLCSSCVMPGVNIGTSQHRTFGEQYDMPNDKMYGTLTSTFYVDGHLHVKKLFDQWFENIMDPVARTFKFYEDYTAKDATITVFDSAGNPHYKMKIDNLYPKSINDIQLSHDSHDFMKLDVTWSYRRWTSERIENSLHDINGPVNTLAKPSFRDTLLGYVGNFKDYQSRFNNITGDVNRAGSMIKNGDFGGLVGQNFGGGSLF